jgi:hypothetical protein
MLNNTDSSNTATTISRADREMWASAILDGIRFRSHADAVLARYEDVDAILPSDEELEKRGADIVVLAEALEAGLRPGALRKAVRRGYNLGALCKALSNGMDVVAFGNAVELIRVKHFAGMVERLDTETLNAGLEHLVEHRAEVRLFPTPMARTMNRLDIADLLHVSSYPARASRN